MFHRHRARMALPSHSAALSGRIPPVGQKRAWANGADSALSAATPPEASAGKEFEPVEPEVHSAHDVAGCRDAGQVGDARLYHRCGEGFGESRRNDELAARIHRVVELPLVEYRTRPDDRSGHLRHRRIASSASRRAQRDFEHPKACADEGFGKLRPIALAVEHEHRNNRRQVRMMSSIVIACSRAKAAAAPNRPGCG